MGRGRALNTDGSYKYSSVTGRGLGYYVHYRWTNYHEYGITWKDRNGISANAALQKNHQHLKENLKLSVGEKQGLKQLEDFLNGWIDSGSSNNLESWAKKYNLTKQETEELEKNIMNELNKKFPQYMSNLYSMDLTSFSELQNLYIYQGKGANNKKYIYMSTFKKLYSSLEDSLNEVNKKLYNINGLKKKERTSLMHLQKKIENILSEMSKIVYDSSVISKSGKSIFLTSWNRKPIEKVIQMVGNIQKSFIKPNPDEQGEMAEIALSMFFALISGKIGNTFDDLVEGIYKGKQHATSTPVFKGNSFIQADFFIEELNKKAVGISKTDRALGKQRYSLQNGDVVDVIGSQQTTDLVVTLPEAFSDWNVNNLTASLKNYNNPNSHIKILSETNLLIAFNFVEQDFANHYLNIFSSTGDTYDRPMAEQYNDELKRALLVRGLMGIRNISNPSTITSEIADIFIVHSKHPNKFYIYNTGDLASKYFDKVDEIIVSGLPSQGQLMNIWQGEKNVYSMMNAMQRITKMLVSARKIKLSASISNLTTIGAM